MEFGLSEEQRLFDEAVRGFLADRVPMEERRRLAEGDGFDAALWHGLVELGLTGVLVPERFGGSGLGVFDAALAAEALGAAAAPVPFAGPAVMAPLALLAAGDGAQQGRWLPRIAAGEARIAVAFAGLAGTPGTDDLRLEGSRLTGTVRGVMDVAGATDLLVVLRDGRMAVLPAAADGVTVTVRRSLDRTRA
ncbi:MAG: acyl-CoA dehydrogenase family protein, partial [Alphaproteobacteria bacterium]